MEYLEQASRQRKPFILFFAPNAPHDPVTPANEDLNLLTDLPPHRPPSFNEADVSDKPGWLAAKPLLTEEEITGIDEFRRNQLLTLISLDRTIGRVMTELQNTGLLDNTFIQNTNTTGYADIAINYGIGGDRPVTGDWDNDGIDTIGVLRGNIFYLRNSNTIGYADMYFALGIPGDMPIAGNWDGKP